MSLNAILAGMGSPIEDAARHARSFSDLQALSDKQVAAERSRIQYLRDEDARRGLMEQEYQTDRLPKGQAPMPVAGLPTEYAPVSTASDDLDARVMNDETRKRSSTGLDTRVMNDEARKRAAAKGRMPYVDPAGYTPPASMTGPEQLRALQDARLTRFGNPQQAARDSASAYAMRSGAAPTPGVEPPAEAPAAPTAAAPASAGFDALAQAVKMVESRGDPNAVSKKGAVGTMQTMPETLRDPGYGVRPAQNNTPAELERVGRDYLQAMIAKYPNNLSHALAAYNWGPGNTDKWIAAGADPAKLPKETRDYIPKVMARLGGAQAPVAQAPAVPTQAAAAPASAAATAPATMFSRENIANTAAQTGEELRYAELQLAEINRQLKFAPDRATAQQLTDAANKLRFGARNAIYRDAAVRAASGNEDAMAQLAQVAGVQYALTPQGYVEAALEPTSGQYRAVSQPMSREDFVNNLYSVASGAAAKQAELANAQAIKTRGEMQVNQQKFGQDLQLEILKGEQALQKLIVEAKVKPTESKITISSFDGKAYVTNKDGVFVVEPGRTVNGIPTEPTLVPIPAGAMPSY
jgi:hypothetical protein